MSSKVEGNLVDICQGNIQVRPSSMDSKKNCTKLNKSKGTEESILKTKNNKFFSSNKCFRSKFNINILIKKGNVIFIKNDINK